MKSQISIIPETLKTALSGVFVIIPKRFEDERGFFSESWNRAAFAAAGLNLPDFVQDNHSLSNRRGTVRGLHFQSPPHAQGKLVRCGQGAVFDVVVDVRKGSPTYGRWIGEELSFENDRQLWIPQGFLHGYMTLEPECEVIYKCSDYYVPECDGAVRWDSVGIDWPLSDSVPILSEKDAKAIPMSDFQSPFTWEG